MRQVQKLTAAVCKAITARGYHPDGDGLYLRCDGAGDRGWVFRYRFGQKTRELGLGPLRLHGLQEARQQLIECRQMLWRGSDPLAERGKLQKAIIVATAVVPSFRKCAEKFIAERAAVPYAEIPALFAEVVDNDSVQAAATQFCFFTIGRTANILDTRWSEIDEDKGIWIIPPEDMKKGREHRVPLSTAARAILARMKGSGRAIWSFRVGAEMVSSRQLHAQAGQVPAAQRDGTRDRAGRV